MGGNEVWCSVLGADTPANAALNFPTTAPAATIDYVIAQKVLGPGDEIRVDAGSYDVAAAITLTSADDGDATGNVTVRGALNGSTRLAAIHDDNNTKTERVFYLNGSNYVVLRDLEIRKGANLGGGTEGYGVQVSDTTNFQAINCWIHDNASYGLVISKTTVGGVVASHVVDSCQINANGGTGLQVARQTGCTITANRIFSNGGSGIQFYDDCSDNQVFDNVVYSNTGVIGVHYTEDSGVSQSGGAFFRNRVYGHQQDVRFTNTDGVTIRNNTVYHVTAGANNTGFLFEGDNSSSGWTLRNNIVVDTVASSPCVTVLGGSETGSNSRYNDFYPTGTALVGSYLASNASTLATWFSLSGWDNPSGVSLSKDPGFVDFNGIDDTLGGAGGLDDDFHLVSTFGYYTNSGGPFFDRNSDSPAIDAADPADAVGGETADHGGRMNQGAYGGTATAARSGDPTYTHTWTGWSILHDDAVNYAASADWNNANNWSGRAVPPATANVLIPDRSGVDEDPNTGGTQAPSPAQPNADTTVNGVYVSDTAVVYPAAGAVATLQMANATSYTLTASGAAALAAGQTDPIQVTSTGRIVLRTGALAVTTGDLRIDAGGLLTADTAGASGAVTATLDCAGTLSVTTAGGTMALQNHAAMSGTITGATGTTVQFTGSQATQTLSHTGGGSFAGLVVNKASGTVDVATSLTVSEGLTVTSGTFRLGATGTVLILQAPSTVGAAGVFSMEGTTTVRFNQAAPSATSPQLLVAGTFRTTGTTGSFPVLTRDLDGGGEGNDTNSVTISITGTSDINGLTLRRLGSIAGPPTVDGLQVAAGATATNVNDIAVVSSGVGVNWLKTSGVFTMRGCSFDASPAWNVQVPTGVGGGSDLRVTLENASGAKGDTPNGEGNDLDPYDATVNPPDGRIVWVYFNWKWLGGSGTNQWDEPVQANDLANWLWQGTGPRPSDFPNGTTESVWIQSPTNPCTENGSFSIKDISITTGATLSEGGGGAFTLTIYGTAFKSSGGTFNAGDGTVTFAGSTTQTVIIIGGSGGFYDLTIAKTAGTTAELGTNLTVARDATVTSGDFDLENYTLTVQGNVTVAAGSTLVAGGTSRLYMNDGAAAKTLTVNGTLEISSTGVVDLGDSGAGGVTLTVGGASGARRLRLLNSAQLRSWDAGESIAFGSGSTFEASGGPTVTRQAGGAGGYSFTVSSGATVEVTQLAFSYAGANGLTVESGASIGNLRNVAFSNVTGAGTRRHLGVGVATNLTLAGLSFDATFDNPPGTGNNVEALTGTNGSTYTMSQWTQTGLADPNTRDLDASEDAANRATVSWARTLTWVGQWRRYRTVSGLAGATASQYVFVRLDAADGLPWTGLDNVNELRVAVQSTTGATWQEVSRNVPTFTPASSIEVHFKLPSDFSGAGGGSVRLYYDYGGSVPAAPALSDAESPKTILSDTFETDKLWTLGAAPASGQWARGAPTGENAFAPSADSTDAGTFAYVTGLATTLDGTATLTSPALVTTNYYKVQATFKRWIFVGGAGDSGSITAASDGVTFSTTIESFPNGTDVRAWTAVAWNAPTGFENVAGPKIRFTMVEGAAPTNCEGGLDDFSFTAYRGDVVANTVGAENDTSVGGTKGKWSEPFHWSNGATPPQLGPPGPSDDVAINGNGTYPPQLDTAGSCLSLRIGQSAASTLDLTGNQALTVGGDLTLETNGTLDGAGDTNTIGVAGSWTRNGSGAFSAGGTTIVFNGTAGANQALIGAMTGSNAFNVLQVNRTGGTGKVSLQSSLDVGSTFTMPATNVSTLDFVGSSSLTMTVTGLATFTGGALAMDTSGASQDLLDCNGGIAFGGSFSLLTTITGGEIRVAGAWDDSTTTGQIKPTGGTIRLDPAPGAPTTYAIRTKGAPQTRFYHLVLAGNANALFTPVNPSFNTKVDGDMTLSGGTFSFDDTVTPTGFGAIAVLGGFIQSGGTIATNLVPGGGSGVNLTVDGDFTASGGSFDNANSVDTNVTFLRVKGNISVTSATWEAGTEFQMSNTTANRTLSMVAGAKIKTLKISCNGRIVSVTDSYVGAGELILSSGTLTVSGASSNVECSVAPAGGWPGGNPANAGFRFNSFGAVTGLILNMQGGAFSTGTSGLFNVGAAGSNGTFNLSAGTVTIGTGGFNFPDAVNFAINLTGGALLCAGPWTVQDTADGDAPTWSAVSPSVVTFNAGGAQSIAHGGGNLGAAAFYGIAIGQGATAPTVSLATDITCNDFDVVEGTFAPGATRTVTTTGASTSDVQAGGTLQLAGGTTLKLAGGATLDINASGTLGTTGTSASSRARVQNNGAGSYALSVSGTMGVDYITIADLGAGGVQVQASGTLTGWTGVRFTTGTAGGAYLDVSLAGAASLPTAINLCQFDGGATINVKSGGAGTTHGNVTFNNWAGALGGEQFESDDNLDLVDWGSGAAVVLRDNTPANPDVAIYATLQDAVNDATALNNVIEVRDNVIRDETLDLSALAFRIVIDGAVLRPPGASTAIVGSGNPALEVLRNVVLIRDAASATPLLRDVANVIHCDVLGPFTTANPLVTVTGPATCLIENSIVGDPGSWQADGDDPISKVGALTVNHSFVDVGVVHPGTNNSLANPQFQNWDPITGGSGLYDVHLKPGSPCVDYAPGPSIAVATDFDRGLDFNSTDQDPGGSNPRRPINARPDAVDGGGPYASWDDDFGTYDVGADELGPLVVGTGSRAQGVPLWTNRAGAGVVADPDSFSVPITSFTFSPAVMFVAENNNVAQAGHDVRLVAYSMNDADSDGDLDVIESLNLTVEAPTIQKVHSITVIGGGSQDNLYLVVDRDGDADTTADAVLAIRYNPTLSPRLAVRGDWTANPAVPAGSGAVGRIVIGQSDGRLYFPRGDGRLYRREATDGTAPAGAGNWLGDGRLDLSGLGYDGKIDAEGSLFAGKFNNSLYVPTNQHANEIIRVQLTDGSVPFAKSCGTGNRNHFGFNVISQSVFVTGADQYVWRIHEDTLAFNAWPAAVWPWQSEPMGATVRTTTRAQMFRTVDANVRVGAGSSIYKFRKDTGVLTDDSDGAGDDWGPGRTFRGNVLTAPTLIGGTGKDYTPVADGRRCGKLVFGTDQGYCYVASYIRATLASDAEDVADATLESQPASAAIVGYDIRDGRPYPGFPYRIPGVKIVNISLLTSSTVGRQVIVFLTDNGWAYGFIEPY